MFIKVIVLFVTILASIQAGAPSQSVSAHANVQQVADGVDGVSLDVKFPFHVGNFFVGFKHSVGLSPRSNSLQYGDETLFVQRSVKTGSSGEANIDAELDTKSRVLSVAAEWASKKLGLSVSVNADTKDKVKELGVKGSKAINGNDLGFGIAYDVRGQSVNVDGSVAKDDTTVKFGYNTGSRTPEVSVVHSLNERNSIAPAVNLKTGEVDLAWNRKWDGGSLESKISIPEPTNAFSVADKSLSLNWKDDSHGGWSTKADIPLSNVMKSKLSVSRDFNV